MYAKFDWCATYIPTLNVVIDFTNQQRKILHVS
jgi:hypothetical protein